MMEPFLIFIAQGDGTVSIAQGDGTVSIDQGDVTVSNFYFSG